MNENQTTVVVVAGHALVRDGIRALLERERDLYLVGEAPDVSDALGLQLDPLVVVLDVGVPGMQRLEGARQLLAHFPRARLVCLSSCIARRQVDGLLGAGAKGCLDRKSGAIDLVKAVRAAARDEPFVSTPPPEHPGHLSPREEEVLQLLAEGFTSKEIAMRLEVAVSTVETYRKQLMTKLDLHSIAALTRFAVRSGLAPLD